MLRMIKITSFVDEYHIADDSSSTLLYFKNISNEKDFNAVVFCFGFISNRKPCTK